MALGGSAPRRYAEALLDIAASESAIPAYRRSLESLAAALRPELLRALRDPRVPLDRRRATVAEAAKDEPKAVRAVLDLLLQRDRIDILPGISRAFGELVDRREGIVKAKITTPVVLDGAQQEALVRRLEEASGKKVRATFAVDASLIGGAKVQVGDRLIDASLRTQLGELARAMASS